MLVDVFAFGGEQTSRVWTSQSEKKVRGAVDVCCVVDLPSPVSNGVLFIAIVGQDGKMQTRGCHEDHGQLDLNSQPRVAHD